MATEPLLLAAREFARGSMSSLPASFEVVSTASSSAHLAVLFRSRTERNCVRLGVFKTDGGNSLEAPELVDLLPEPGEPGVSHSADDNWTLVWSPDLKFLIVSGQLPRAEGESEGVMWIFARPEWQASITSETTSRPPLLLCVEPTKYLSAKHWNPATGLVNVFFPTQSGSKVFVLSEDGVWLSLSVQLAKLALIALDSSIDITGLFTIKTVKKLTEWHAGVTAACYDPESSILVVSGGVRNPSVDLMEKQASSLSVWKVMGTKDNKEAGELLDFTMVLKDKTQHVSEINDETGMDLVEEGEGLLTSIKKTLCAPLKMMVGNEPTESRVIQGSIRHLALAPNGHFVSMVDDLGRVAIRQIDACTDVLKWQTGDDVCANTQGIALKMVVWLTSGIVALLLTNNSVVYSKFITHFEEGAVSESISSDNENESVSSSQSSGRLVVFPVKHYRPMSAASGSVQTLALDAHGLTTRSNHTTGFSVYEFVTTNELWTANQVQNLTVESFLELLMDAQEFEDALATVALYEMHGIAINADDIHCRIWIKYRTHAGRFDSEPKDLVLLSTQARGILERGERDEFVAALDHLRAISDQQWVLSECLRLIADDSSARMKKLLDVAWDAWSNVNNGNEVATELSQDKMDLQRYLYRLETFRLILCEEEGVSTTSVAGDQLFDGAAYARFRSSSIVSIAKQLAQEGRVSALTVLFHRQGWNLIPHWLDILELMPPSVPPSRYKHLLPATQIEDDGEFYTLVSNSSDGDGDFKDLFVSIPLLPENRRQDLTDEELSAFQECFKLPREERNSTYGKWFSRRVLEMDTHFGQLRYAYELSQIATKCLSGWSSSEAKKTVEELFQHTERLYQCVYSLRISTCFLLPLSEWCVLSMEDQIMIVVGSDKPLVGDISPIIERVETVFVSQRRDRTYALDQLFSWLAQTMASKSLSDLTLAAQIIQRSNPSIRLIDRWIQSDVQLIETALDVVYSVDLTDIIRDKSLSMDKELYLERHLALVEQLWTIFQSLPARKEKDLPEIAQLQVAVDEMEDLMVTMDVLSKYGIISSPGGLKYKILASNDGDNGSSGGPHGLLEQMCAFALPGEYSDDEKQWLEVLQDAIKLKEHAFGERLSDEKILDVIFKHLVASDRVYIDAAQNLVNYWIISDVEAVDHVLHELLVTIRAKFDSVSGYSDDVSANTVHESALGCVGIVQQVLSLPLWEEETHIVTGTKQHYQEVLNLETDRAQACELLDLLTYGAVKLSPAELRGDQVEREEEKENIRLDAVCQVFTSNPSNYKPSVRAKEWLAQHYANEEEEDTADELWNEPLAVIMHLAKLLRVDSHKLEIWMKGAYAALYCMDYDVAYDLTLQIIDGIPREMETDTASHTGNGDKLTLVHLVSLVLDLVSASPFRSWGKKHKLCVALFSAANVSSSDLFTHQVTDLVLSWLEKIEAIQALMVELGLSDIDLEQRRLTGGKTSSSTEAVLLNELKMVVDLLHEEKKDRQFLLRLLQCGLQLTHTMINSDTSDDNQATSELTLVFLTQMIQLCMEEAVTSATRKVEDWQQYMELGLNYLMLWGDLCTDDDSFKTFCMENILSLVFIESATDSSLSSETGHTNEAIIRYLHHFFLLQAVQAKENTTDNEPEALSARRERLETLFASYETTRRAHGALSDMTTQTEKNLMNPQRLMSKQRYQIYTKLAQRCQEQLISQKKSQELEQMSTFFNAELDLERFSHDESYRKAKIMVLATKKEHFQLSRQFATKYGMNEYDCVLTYIKHALLFPSDPSSFDRREQLDQAFAIDHVDILEEALQRPRLFGDFLLQKETPGDLSIYEAIDGTDHVGVLLVLRMILECSKRLDPESIDSEERSLFPLSKPSIDRITLLFMCLKKLKDIGDSLDKVEVVDLKLLGAASTTAELLTPLTSSHEAMTVHRDAAVDAVRPLLTGKTIKFVTKIMRKLHHVTPSSMVMIYMNNLLTGIWRQHGATGTSTRALSADLAVYAYESCVPCLSVLSNEHLMLFSHLFLNGFSGKSLPDFVAHLKPSQEFYGQSLAGLQHFGALLTPRKRVELVAETLTLFQTKYSAWQSSGPPSNVSSASSSSSSASWDPTQFKRKEQELHYLERELAGNVCCLVLSEIEQCGLILTADEEVKTSFESVVTRLKTWFAMDSLHQIQVEEALHSTVFVELCQCVASVDLASLVMQVILRAGGSKASNEVARKTITQSYQNAVVNLVQRYMSSSDEQTVPWVEQVVWTWVTGADAPNSSQMTELGCYLEATCGSHDEQTPGSSRAVYEQVVSMLSQSPSTLLKEIGLSRLGAMQTHIQTDSIAVAVRQAVFSQWEQLIATCEDHHKWTEAAVLNHVLVTHDNAGLSVAAAHGNFGLRVKAVWSALLAKHKLVGSTAAQRVFDVPNPDLSSHFAAVFEELLTFIEGRSGDDNLKTLRFAEMATVALGNLLVRHNDSCSGSEGAAQRSALTWQLERQQALQTRVQAQFQVGIAINRKISARNDEDVMCWSALFARGVWGAHLLTWYTTYAYAELRDSEDATEAVILIHWEAHNLEVALQLLLMCPFDGLRDKYVDRALSAVQQLPQGSVSWSRVMELALLRFDVAVLLQHGLHSSIVVFLLQDTNRNSALWTSSGDYVVCALVTQGEFAAAGRLTCALRHAHPLLWDVESARLLLANHLRSLASSSVQHKSKSISKTDLQHAVYVQTSRRLAETFL